MIVPLLTKRDRRLLRTVIAEYPGLAEIIQRVEVVASRAAVLDAHEAESRVAAAERRAELAERRERDSGHGVAALKRRIAELESRP